MGHNYTNAHTIASISYLFRSYFYDNFLIVSENGHTLVFHVNAEPRKSIQDAYPLGNTSEQYASWQNGCRKCSLAEVKINIMVATTLNKDEDGMFGPELSQPARPIPG